MSRRAEQQAQREVAIRTIHLDEVLRQVLSVLDPQPGDAHLTYTELLHRVVVVVHKELHRLEREG